MEAGEFEQQTLFDALEYEDWKFPEEAKERTLPRIRARFVAALVLSAGLLGWTLYGSDTSEATHEPAQIAVPSAADMLQRALESMTPGKPISPKEAQILADSLAVAAQVQKHPQSLVSLNTSYLVKDASGREFFLDNPVLLSRIVGGDARKEAAPYLVGFEKRSSSSLLGAILVDTLGTDRILAVEGMSVFTEGPLIAQNRVVVLKGEGPKNPQHIGVVARVT